MGNRTKGSAARRWVSAVAVTSVLVGTLVAGQAPAAADLPGAVVVTAETAFDSEPTKTVAARCPAGTQVTGGAGDLRVGGREPDGLEGQVALTRLQPVHTNNRDRYVVSASEAEFGTTKSWSVQAFAFCASPLPGYQLVSKTAADGGLPRVSVPQMLCPAGKRIIGGGGRISGGRGEVQLNNSNFDPDEIQSSEWRAEGIEDSNGFTGRWTVTAYAVCADIAMDVRHVSDSVGGAADRKVAAAQCPNGTRVIAGSAGLFGSDADAVLESITPTRSGFGGRERTQGTLPTGVQVTAQERAPTNDNWNLVAHALCA